MLTTIDLQLFGLIVLLVLENINVINSSAIMTGIFLFLVLKSGLEIIGVFISHYMGL